MKQTNKLPNITSGSVNTFTIGDTFIYNNTLYLLTHIDPKANSVEVFDLTNQCKGIMPKATFGVKVDVTFTVEGIK